MDLASAHPDNKGILRSVRNLGVMEQETVSKRLIQHFDSFMRKDQDLAAPAQIESLLGLMKEVSYKPTPEQRERLIKAAGNIPTTLLTQSLRDLMKEIL
jgi:hypothetical protein